MFEELHTAFQVTIIKVPSGDNILRNMSAFCKAKKKWLKSTIKISTINWYLLSRIYKKWDYKTTYSINSYICLPSS